MDMYNKARGGVFNVFNFSMPELVLILVIALVVFGPGKLPEVGKAIGRGINEFKGAIGGENKENKETIPQAQKENKENKG